MIDLKKSALPQSVEVNGRRFRIHTSFRYWLRFSEHIKEKDAKIADFDYMYILDKPENRAEGIRALCDFFNPPQELPRSIGKQTAEKVLDYEIDAPYIYAAFYEQYGIDLYEKELHWHKFLALLHGLHDTELNNIISARLYVPTGKKDEYEKQRQRQLEAWRLPQDAEPDKAYDDFMRELGE